MKKVTTPLVFLLFTFVSIDTRAQTSTHSSKERWIGGIMMDQNLSFLGFYELSISDKLLIINRLGLKPGYLSNDGINADPTIRFSLRYMLFDGLKGDGASNCGWYIEAASPVVFTTSASDFTVFLQFQSLSGYRGKLGKKIIIEGSLGVGTNFGSTTAPIGNNMIYPVINVGLAYLLFSKSSK